MLTSNVTAVATDGEGLRLGNIELKNLVLSIIQNKNKLFWHSQLQCQVTFVIIVIINCIVLLHYLINNTHVHN